MLFTCRICGDPGDKETYSAPEMMFGYGGAFVYFLCSSCGCLQIGEFPREMSRFYPEGYYSLGKKKIVRAGPFQRYLKKERAKYVLTGRSAAGRLAVSIFGMPSFPAWMAKAGILPDSRVLDLGCGAGRFLLYLASQGFTSLTGADPFIEKELLYSCGVRVLKAQIGEAGGTFDLILMDHSLEHMADQHGAVRAAGERLTEGGRIVIRIPLVSPGAWKEYGTDWVQLDAPRHFFLHSERSFKMLVSGAGLEVIGFDYDSTAFQFWGSEQYRRKIPLMDERSYLVSPERSVFSESDIEEFGRMAARLNADGSGDQACFILGRI